MEIIEHRVPVSFDGKIHAVDLTLSAHNRVVAIQPRVHRPTPSPVEAYPNAALLVPSRLTQYRHPISVILAAVHAARQSPDPTIILVAGVTATDEPASLAHHRAEALRCLIENDVPGWKTVATDAGSLLEIKAYLDYLAEQRGWSCRVETIDATADAAAERSVWAFQEEFNLRFEQSIDVDGVCGTETLGAVLEVLRFEWDRWLEKHGLTQADVDGIEFVYGRGAGPGSDPRALEALGGLPGVDLVVIRKQDLQGAELTAELVFGSRTARWETFDVPIEWGGWEFGNYTIVTDLAPGESEPLETYRLASTDGSWASELEVARDGVADGLVELRFTEVPCDRRFGLFVTVEGVGEYVLFEDLAYSDLHKVATGELVPSTTSTGGTDG